MSLALGPTHINLGLEQRKCLSHPYITGGAELRMSSVSLHDSVIMADASQATVMRSADCKNHELSPLCVSSMLGRL